MLTPVEIEKIQKYFASAPVTRAFLVGSVARNEESIKSDIDILVEIDETERMSLVKFIRLQLDLEKMFRKKVDLLESGGISKSVMPFIEQDKKLIYERPARQ